MSEEMKFASIGEAIQHLSDFTGQKVIVAAFVKPKSGDMAVIHHPQDKKFYVFKLTKENLSPGGLFQEKDLKSEDTYSENVDMEKIDLALDKKYGLHSKIDSIQRGDISQKNIEDVPSILFADYKKSDRDLEEGSLDFATDRNYSEIVPATKRLERIKKNPNRAKGHAKKTD